MPIELMRKSARLPGSPSFQNALKAGSECGIERDVQTMPFTRSLRPTMFWYVAKLLRSVCAAWQLAQYGFTTRRQSSGASPHPGGTNWSLALVPATLGVPLYIAVTYCAIPALGFEFSTI